MPSCERCWEMATTRAILRPIDREEEYRTLLLVNDCTPEQQAGREATWCAKCETRTVHQHTRQCIACGYDAKGGE